MRPGPKHTQPFNNVLDIVFEAEWACRNGNVAHIMPVRYGDIVIGFTRSGGAQGSGETDGNLGSYAVYARINPADPTYSGLEAVYDPGVAWVFLGFFLICVGVFYMFYVEPRLKVRG